MELLMTTRTLTGIIAACTMAFAIAPAAVAQQGNVDTVYISKTTREAMLCPVPDVLADHKMAVGCAVGVAELVKRLNANTACGAQEKYSVDQACAVLIYSLDPQFIGELKLPPTFTVRIGNVAGETQADTYVSLINSNGSEERLGPDRLYELLIPIRVDERVILHADAGTGQKADQKVGFFRARHPLLSSPYGRPCGRLARDDEEGCEGALHHAGTGEAESRKTALDRMSQIFSLLMKGAVMTKLLPAALVSLSLLSGAPALAEPETKTELINGGERVQHLSVRNPYYAAWVIDTQRVLYIDTTQSYFLVTTKADCSPLAIKGRTVAFFPDTQLSLRESRTYELRPEAGQRCDVSQVAKLDKTDGKRLRDGAMHRLWW